MSECRVSSVSCRMPHPEFLNYKLRMKLKTSPNSKTCLIGRCLGHPVTVAFAYLTGLGALTILFQFYWVTTITQALVKTSERDGNVTREFAPSKNWLTNKVRKKIQLNYSPGKRTLTTTYYLSKSAFSNQNSCVCVRIFCFVIII